MGHTSGGHLTILWDALYKLTLFETPSGRTAGAHKVLTWSVFFGVELV